MDDIGNERYLVAGYLSFIVRNTILLMSAK